MRSNLLSLPLFLATMSAGYLLPNPSGKYNVTLTIEPLTDPNRDARKLMISIFQPTSCATTVPAIYMPNKTAEHEGPWIQRTFGVSEDITPLLSQARFPVCSNASCTPIPNAPVILLSPGYRGTRTYYNFLASALASEGYTVITMDHPGETNVVVYPDGSAAYADLPDPADLSELLPYGYTRAADASFIVDQLNNATAMPNLARNFPTQRVVMAGHSLGGAAAHIAAEQDARIVAVVNWDGPYFGVLPPMGRSKPVLYIATEDDPEKNPRMGPIWPELAGPKLWIKIRNMRHSGMLDLPILLKAAGEDPTKFAELLGTVDAEEGVRIMAAYTTAWGGGVMAGKVGGELLEGLEPGRFPEVEVVKKENF